MEYVADELEEVEFEGQRRWVRREDVEQIVEAERVHSVKLLPSWDCYVMFYHPRELFVCQSHRARIFTKLQGNRPVLLIDGVAGGVWEQRRKTQPCRSEGATIRSSELLSKAACYRGSYEPRGIYRNNRQHHFSILAEMRIEIHL